MLNVSDRVVGTALQCAAMAPDTTSKLGDTWAEMKHVHTSANQVALDFESIIAVSLPCHAQRILCREGIQVYDQQFPSICQQFAGSFIHGQALRDGVREKTFPGLTVVTLSTCNFKYLDVQCTLHTSRNRKAV